MSLEDALQKLGSSADGLSQAEAQSRLARDGYNELVEEEVNPILKFLSYFWGPIPWMIEAAAILSAVVGHWADFAIILALLLVNGVVGFWEEHRAGHLTIFLTRTRGHFWFFPPAPILGRPVPRLQKSMTCPAAVCYGFRSYWAGF